MQLSISKLNPYQVNISPHVSSTLILVTSKITRNVSVSSNQWCKSEWYRCFICKKKEYRPEVRTEYAFFFFFEISAGYSKNIWRSSYIKPLA